MDDRRHRVNPGRVPRQPRGTSDYLPGWRDGYRAGKAGKVPPDALAKLRGRAGAGGGGGGTGGGGRTKPRRGCLFSVVLAPALPVLLVAYLARCAVSLRRGATSPRPAIPHRMSGGAPGGSGAGPITGSGRHPHTGMEVS